jgi:glycerophosphoryl diester phosphodiesterase
MAVSFHARDNGFTHVCGHRGYSLLHPENTILGLEAARRAGATACEIDVMLTRDEEIVVMHDPILDRTTSGHGFVADHDLAALRILQVFAHDRSPSAPTGTIATLGETLRWARETNVGLIIEMKERERPDILTRKLVEVIRETDAFGVCEGLSFNHVDLQRLKNLDGRIRTEAITHAHHVDVFSVLRACRADSVSIELGMFDPDEARAVHDAGYSNRLNLPPPARHSPYWSPGRDWRGRIGTWLRQGLIDTLSGDDVPFLRQLVDEFPIEGR